MTIHYDNINVKCIGIRLRYIFVRIVTTIQAFKIYTVCVIALNFVFRKYNVKMCQNAEIHEFSQQMRCDLFQLSIAVKGLS